MLLLNGRCVLDNCPAKTCGCADTQMFIQYLTVEVCFHDTLKSTGLSCPILTDSSPHMYLGRMFWLGFVPQFLSTFVTTKPSMSLHWYSHQSR